MIKKLILFLSINIVFGCIDGEEVELWGDCYNIDNTFNIDKTRSGVSSIPSEISELKNLTYLFLGNNWISSIPPEIGELKNLILLNLDHNKIKFIPYEISNLTSLEYLSLNDNLITGKFPPFLLKLSNLEILNLSKNKFNGEIPSEITDLSKLMILWIDNNEFYGRIPESISNLQNLSLLSLSNNNLEGEIPVKLEKLWEEFGICINGNNMYNGLNSPIITEYSNNGKLEKYSSDYFSQKWIKYHKNGKKWYEGKYNYQEKIGPRIKGMLTKIPGRKKIGVFTEWYESGKIKQIETYISTQKYSLKKFSYNSHGDVSVEKEFIVIENSNGKIITKHGKWIYYNENGSIQKEEIYKDEKLIETIDY